jgi:hypothetical protein
MKKIYKKWRLQISITEEDVICTSGELQETGVQWQRDDGNSWNGNLFG